MARLVASPAAAVLGLNGRIPDAAAVPEWYFEPDPVSAETGGSGADAGVAPGIAYVPPASRQRHGARLLDPGDAPTIPGSRQRGWGRTPSSSVYRSRTLLIPADLLRDDAAVAAINTALAPVGMGILLPDLDSRPVRSEGPVAEALPRIVGLVPAVPAAGRPSAI